MQVTHQGYFLGKFINIAWLRCNLDFKNDITFITGYPIYCFLLPCLEDRAANVCDLLIQTDLLGTDIRLPKPIP